MIKIAIVLCIYLVVPSIFVGQQGNDIFLKFDSNDAVMKQAKKTGKKIFYDFTTNWCVPCGEMDAHVYTDSLVRTLLVEQFLPVKVQTDLTKEDARYITKWFKDSEDLSKKFKVGAFPTFVFLSPKGELLGMEFGYHSPSEFVKILNMIEDTAYAYYRLVDLFEKNKLPTGSLLGLAIRAKQYKEDNVALQIVSKYKSEDFARRPKINQLNKDFVDLVTYFPDEISESDSIIRFMYQHPGILDSTIRPGISQDYLIYFISRDVVDPIIAKAESVHKEPNWTNIRRKISMRYDDEAAKRITSRNQLAWYYKKKDWNRAIKYEIEKIEEEGVPEFVKNNALQVNNLVFNLIFKKSDNPVYLKKALKFMEIILENNPDDQAGIDTYANVLYKLGQKERAIEQETRALELARERKASRDIQEFQNTLMLMKNNMRTWN